MSLGRGGSERGCKGKGGRGCRGEERERECGMLPSSKVW